MSGFVQAFSPCLGCGRVFGYNPHRVPSSSAITGEREPICASCYALIQRNRKERGLPPFPDPHPDAYEPMPEEEL
jgi:hypothetical protein